MKKIITYKKFIKENAMIQPKIRFGSSYDKYLGSSYISKEISARKPEYKKSYLIRNKPNAPMYSAILNILKDGSAILNAKYTTYSGVDNRYNVYFNLDGKEIIHADNSEREEKKYFYSEKN